MHAVTKLAKIEITMAPFSISKSGVVDKTNTVSVHWYCNLKSTDCRKKGQDHSWIKTKGYAIPESNWWPSLHLNPRQCTDTITTSVRTRPQIWGKVVSNPFIEPACTHPKQSFGCESDVITTTPIAHVFSGKLIYYRNQPLPAQFILILHHSQLI